MAHRTIHLKGEVYRDEAKASGTPSPGMLLKRTDADTVAVHDAAGAATPILIAVEDELAGEEIGTAYTAGRRVQFNRYQKGDQFVGLIADGQNVAFGDKLVSNGDGYLKKDSGTQDVLAIALEAVDMSGSSDPDPYCAVEVV